MLLLDAAVISPFASGRGDAPFTETTDGSCPGANTYGERKVNAYSGGITAHTSYSVVPIIMDMLGCWGSPALKLIRRAAIARGKRFDVHPSRSIPLAFQRINIKVMRCVARLLSRNASSSCFIRRGSQRATASGPAAMTSQSSPQQSPRSSLVSNTTSGTSDESPNTASPEAAAGDATA